MNCETCQAPMDELRARIGHTSCEPCDITSAAYHEAGHAVVCYFQRIEVRRVSVVSDDIEEHLGITHHGGAPKRVTRDASDYTRMKVERYVVMCFAGQLSQAKLRDKHPEWGMEGDDRNAIEITLQMFGNEEIAGAFRHYCWCLSRALVTQYWRLIEAVAAALLQRKTLSGPEVEEIIYPGSAAFKAHLKQVFPKPSRDPRLRSQTS
jgi:hypothetical protein